MVATSYFCYNMGWDTSYAPVVEVKKPRKTVRTKRTRQTTAKNAGTRKGAA